MSEPIKLSNEEDYEEDTDDSSKQKKGKKSDFVNMGSKVLCSINFKIAIFLFFIGMLIFSDLFIDSFLSKIDGSVYGECTTTKGTMIQLLIFVISYLIIDLLVKGEWI